MLLPETPPRIISGGKEGVLYLLDRDNMGKLSQGSTGSGCKNPNAVQEVLAFERQSHNGETHWGNIHGSPVFWKGGGTAQVYAWGENNTLKAYRLDQGRLQDVDNPKRSAYRPPLGMPGGMLAVSANGGNAGTGVLWAVVPLDGDANRQRGVKGIVLALDAQDVSRTLWTSEQQPERDRLGLFAKFTPPMVAGGKLFVATYGDDEQRRTYQGNDRPTSFPASYYVAVYGLRAGPIPGRDIVDQDRDDVTVVRASTGALSLDTSRCARLDAGSIDCTDALAQAAQAPSFHRVILAADQEAAQCELLRVTTVAKDGGLATAQGIGFWSTQATDANMAADNTGRFVALGELKAVGTATLRNGAAATLHEFVGVVNCPAGAAGPLVRLFKPYMEFAGADGRIFHNWDLASNYRISSAATEFNRSSDVLRP